MATKRVNVNFSPEAYSTLERLAQEKGKTMSEVLRDAIALEKWLTDVSKEGAHILVEKPDGKVRELLRR
jgi:predicted DNA-binding protein